MYNGGISIAGDILDLGVPLGVIQKNGNSYTFVEEALGVGREKARMYLMEHPKLMKTIRKEIEKKVEAGITEPEPSAPAAE